MGYFYTTEPEIAAIPKESSVSPKTHTPCLSMKERGQTYHKTGHAEQIDGFEQAPTSSSRTRPTRAL